MQIESTFMYIVVFFQSSFSESPEGFNTINMIFSTGTFIWNMAYPKMFFVTYFDQAVIAWPFVRMNDTVGINLPADDCL